MMEMEDANFFNSSNLSMDVTFSQIRDASQVTQLEHDRHGEADDFDEASLSLLATESQIDQNAIPYPFLKLRLNFVETYD